MGVTVYIDNIKDISIDEYTGIQIEFRFQNGTSTRFWLSLSDAEFLKERLEEFFHGQTFGDLKCEYDDKLQELREECRALREENVSLRMG